MKQSVRFGFNNRSWVARIYGLAELSAELEHPQSVIYVVVGSSAMRWYIHLEIEILRLKKLLKRMRQLEWKVSDGEGHHPYHIWSFTRRLSSLLLD